MIVVKFQPGYTKTLKRQRPQRGTQPAMATLSRAATLQLLAVVATAAAASKIDRRALVSRHDVRASNVDSAAPLTVGNGEFGFTADVTGLQTLNSSYTDPPLQTMSHWGWHRVPPSIAGADSRSYEFEQVAVSGHTAHYATNLTKTPTYNYLRENPHRINLARISLRRLQPSTAPGAPIEANQVSTQAPPHHNLISKVSLTGCLCFQLTAIDQTLHLWNGSLSSSFTLDSSRVTVATTVHPTLDSLAVKICSPLIAHRKLGLGVA